MLLPKCPRGHLGIYYNFLFCPIYLGLAHINKKCYYF